MKTVIITGAGGNLGTAAVSVFAEAGWRIVALVSPGKLPSGKMEGVEFLEADLLDESATAGVVASVIAQYGQIDAALLLVGGFEAGTVESTDSAALRRMFALNVETAYHVARPLFLAMQNQKSGGRLIFVGARPALNAAAGKSLVAYGLSKSQLFKLAEYLNAASTKVRSHVAVFTALDTPQNRASMPNADRSGWVTPEKAAGAMLAAVLDTNAALTIEVS
jgi:NAD(P)-dependent dehydrogenase (short-subunit alcohol dehydrogenase family)